MSIFKRRKTTPAAPPPPPAPEPEMDVRLEVLVSPGAAAPPKPELLPYGCCMPLDRDYPKLEYVEPFNRQENGSHA